VRNGKVFQYYYYIQKKTQVEPVKLEWEKAESVAELRI